MPVPERATQWWDAPRFEDLNWLARLVATAEGQQTIAGRSWDRWLATGNDAFSDEAAAAIETMIEHWPRIEAYLSTPPTTLVHGDFKPDNLCFPDGPLGQLVEGRAAPTTLRLSASVRRSGRQGVSEIRRRQLVVMGAGVAGLASSIHLARRGADAICVDPRSRGPRVGESLDWSTPRLLTALGMQPDALVSAGDGTFKRGIEVSSAGGATVRRRPLGWFGRWPMGFERSTFHVDRERFDRTLLEAAVAAGVEFVWDSVAALETDGDRVAACQTRGGDRIEGDYFVDASGARRLIGRFTVLLRLLRVWPASWRLAARIAPYAESGVEAARDLIHRVAAVAGRSRRTVLDRPAE